MPLQEFFHQHITTTDLFSRGEKTLLAVSGGIDSVVMAHLFKNLNLPFAIAHCNFNLRGTDSEQDALFVKELSEQLEVKYFTHSFATATEARQRKISIQMAARELRYDWFEQVRKQQGYQYIATAHHEDDQNETIMINITRGCGLEGLAGIKSKRAAIIRPLLPFSRQQIETFAAEHHIDYREDSSNVQDKYLRNKIRHQLIPVCRQINPSFSSALERLSDIAMASNQLLDWFINREGLVQKQGLKTFIDITAIEKYPSVGIILYVLLKEFGFQAPVVSDLAQRLHAAPGKFFYSSTHVCLKDRDKLIIMPIESVAEPVDIVVNANTQIINTSSGEFIFEVKAGEEVAISADADIAWLDYDKISFPMLLRHPKKGDSFFPLGMRGRKKISDFLTDHKIARTDKQQTWLLCSEENIIWVAGMRPDDRYKITPETRNVLEVKFIPVNK
jgi:tRNA(Ile)-lysidine synthase